MKLTYPLRGFAIVTLLVAAIATNVACSPAKTEVAAEQSEAGVVKVVADFKTAWESQNYDAMIDLSMPQPLLDQIIKQSGAPPDTSPEELSREIKKMMAGVLADQCDAAPRLSWPPPHGRATPTAGDRGQPASNPVSPTALNRFRLGETHESLPAYPLSCN